VEGKVAVLGNADFVMPFATLGLDTFTAAEDTAETVKLSKEILEGGYALIVVAENVAPLTEEVFAPVQNKTMPAIVVVPFTTESTGFATQALGEVLRMATGINILQNN